MLYVFTVATNIYINYLEYQIKTYKHLFPNINKKFIWFTDDVNKCQELAQKYNYDIDVVKITPLVYPFNTLFKTNYITDYSKTHSLKKDDIIIFIDADTIFVKRESRFWEKLLNDIKTFDCIFSISPWIFDNIHISEQDNYICNIPLNFSKRNYIQDSFFIFKNGIMQEWQIQYDYYLREYTLQKRLPIMQDQTLLNYLIYKNQEKNNIKLAFYFVNYYKDTSLDSCELFDYNDVFINKTYCEGKTGALYTKNINCDNFFMLQKFNNSIKYNIRNTNNIL